MNTRSSTRRARGKRGLVATAILASLAVAAAACSSSGSGTSAKDSVDPNGVIRIGQDFTSTLTDNFDPVASNACSYVVTSFVYDAVLHLDKDGKLEGGLAQSYETAGRVVTLKVRPGVKFTNGAALDAAALQNGLTYNAKNTQANEVRSIDSYQVVDPTTLKITLKTDTATQFLYALTGYQGEILAPGTESTSRDKPVGAGPYKLQTLQVGSKVVLIKNDAYWNASAYKLQTLEFDQVTLGPSAVTAMQSGALDLIKADPISSQPLASDAQFKVVPGASNAYIQLEFRQNRPPFNNIKARQAVAFAIDRDAINKITQNGLGEVASQSYPKSSPVYDPALASVYKYDPAKAKSLLAEAFPNGADISIAYPGGGIVYMQQQVEIVQQELTAVGFRVKLIPLAGSQVAQTYYIDGQGEMFSAAEPAGDFPPSVLDGSFAPGAFVAKYDGAERPDIGALTKQAIAAPTYDQMIALTKQAEKIVVNEALEVPVAFQPQVIAYSVKKIGGTPTPPRGICDAVGLKGVYVKKT